MLARDSHDRRPEDLAGRRWAGYIRESTRGQADRYGPAIQRAEHIRYADRYGLTGSGFEYVDLVSGKETLRRTDFRRMLADAERGAFDVLLCYDTSRFARKWLTRSHTAISWNGQASWSSSARTGSSPATPRPSSSKV